MLTKEEEKHLIEEVYGPDVLSGDCVYFGKVIEMKSRESVIDWLIQKIKACSDEKDKDYYYTLICILPNKEDWGIVDDELSKKREEASYILRNTATRIVDEDVDRKKYMDALWLACKTLNPDIKPLQDDTEGE